MGWAEKKRPVKKYPKSSLSSFIFQFLQSAAVARRLSDLTPPALFLPQISGKSCVTMATRIAARYVSRRLSSSGKMLSEEEKAAETVYIKKKEQEKLEKLARKGPKSDETVAPSSGGSGSVADAKPIGDTSSTPKVSTDNYKNYAVVAGLATAAAAVGWYLGSKKTKPEVQD